MLRKKPSEKTNELTLGPNINEDGTVSEKDVPKIEKFVNNNGSSAFSNAKAHACDHDGSRSEEDILGTILDRKTVRHIDGQFKNKQAQMAMVCELLHAYRFNLDEYKDLNDRGYGNNLRYSVASKDYFDDSTASTGFMEINGFVYPYETKSCATAILKNDNEANSPIGFTLQSIYPGWSYAPFEAVKAVDGLDSDKFKKYEYGIRHLRNRPNDYERELKRRYDDAQSKSNERMTPEDYARYGLKSGMLTIPDKDILPILKKTKVYQDADKVTKFCYELKCDRQLAYPGTGKYDPDKPSAIHIERPKADTRYGNKTSFTIHKDIPDGEFRIFVEDNRQFVIRRYKADPNDPSIKTDVGLKIFVPPKEDFEKRKVKKFMDMDPEQKQIAKLAMKLYDRFHSNDGGKDHDGAGIALERKTEKETAVELS